MSALKVAPGRPRRSPRAGCGRLALARLADHHHGVHIHAGERCKHGVERGAAAVHAVAAPDPVEGGKGCALAHAAERVDELRVCGARGGHGASERNVPFVRLGAGLRGDWVKGSQRTWPLYLMGGNGPRLEGPRPGKVRAPFQLSWGRTGRLSTWFGRHPHLSVGSGAGRAHREGHPPVYSPPPAR